MLKNMTPETDTMKQITVNESGPLAAVMQLSDVAPIPQPAAGEVRVKVEAVGVNFADALTVTGEYLTRTRYPYVPGMEYAGTIDALGEGVTGFGVGQRVACLAGQGGLAQYAVTPANTLVPVPESWNAQQAAAFPVSFLTAYHALKTLGRGEAGEWVLVQAAAGALGSASIQLAKALDMQVIALASTPQKLEMARESGADVTILQDDPERIEKVKEATGGKGAALILEVVGGKRFKESLKMAASRGRIIVIGNASREEAALQPAELMKRNLTVTGLWLTSLLQDAQASREAVQGVSKLLAGGKVAPQPGPSYALADSAQAFEDLLGRKTTGKVIIEPWR